MTLPSQASNIGRKRKRKKVKLLFEEAFRFAPSVRPPLIRISINHFEFYITGMVRLCPKLKPVITKTALITKTHRYRTATLGYLDQQ